MNDLYLQKTYINGKWIDPAEKIDVFSPSTNEKIGEIPALSAEDIAAAYNGSHKAFFKWSSENYEERIKIIERFNEILLANKEHLANLIALEVSKSVKDSLVEVQRSYEYIQETIKWYRKMFTSPSIIDDSIHGIKGKTGKFYNVPIGVVLCVSPFNYPVNLSLGKIIPTLITGNTVVFKPATQASLVGLELAKYFDEANFPKGVINFVTGKGSRIGDALLNNPLLKGVNFTGSTAVGEKIAQACPMKQLALEMGGKDAAIVLDDVDIQKTAALIVKGAFNYSGQRCTAIKRVLITNETADKLIPELVKEISKLKVGQPFENADVVPIIGTKEVAYVEGLIRDAIEKGGKLMTGGRIVGINLIEPTLIDYVPLVSNLAWEEPFGPVLPIIRLKNIAEMIEIANRSMYGLQASIFTSNSELAIEIAKKLDVGTVNINQPSSRGPDVFPFIGAKKSGFNSQGIINSMLVMTRIKGIVENE